jgi:predicted nuclease of predicted toxin-antitoxin system
MLLIDNNLSPKLAGRLQHIFPGMAHVPDFGLEADDDTGVWDFAKSSGFHILTKDKDFNHLLLVRGFPPKVIRLDCGNASTKQIETLLLHEASDIQNFIANPTFGLMVIQ